MGIGGGEKKGGGCHCSCVLEVFFLLLRMEREVLINLDKAHPSDATCGK